MPPSKKQKILKMLSEWKNSIHAMEGFVNANENDDWLLAIPTWLKARGQEIVDLGETLMLQNADMATTMIQRLEQTEQQAEAEDASGD